MTVAKLFAAKRLHSRAVTYKLFGRDTAQPWSAPWVNSAETHVRPRRSTELNLPTSFLWNAFGVHHFFQPSPRVALGRYAAALTLGFVV